MKKVALCCELLLIAFLFSTSPAQNPEWINHNTGQAKGRTSATVTVESLPQPASDLEVMYICRLSRPDDLYR
jgi:hypothetical protein